MVKKSEDMYNCLDRIPACDRQTGGQTSWHGKNQKDMAYMACEQHTPFQNDSQEA